MAELSNEAREQIEEMKSAATRGRSFLRDLDRVRNAPILIREPAPDPGELFAVVPSGDEDDDTIEIFTPSKTKQE